MVKVILGTLFGILISFGGFYAAYIYLDGIENGSSPFLLLLSALLVGGGVYILLRAGKSNASVIVKVDKTKSGAVNSQETGFESMLEKNKKLSEDWSKTVEHRDRLKLLQMSANVKEQAVK